MEKYIAAAGCGNYIYNIKRYGKNSVWTQRRTLVILLFFGLEFILLGIYALLWQQMIKKFELSVAYANRAMAILWSMIWAVLFFHDRITIRNIVGVAIVLVGIVLVNTDKEAEQ